MATGTGRILGWVAAGWAAVFLAGTSFRVLADCSAFGLPFTDLGSTTFCAQIAEAYYSGLTNGTSATAYSPSANVNREQMAAFVTRTLDQSLLRGNRRSALDQWWLTRPQLGWARYRTPVTGLYLASAGTHPGGGLTGGSGLLAARAVLKDLRK